MKEIEDRLEEIFVAVISIFKNASYQDENTAVFAPKTFKAS